MHRQGDWLRSAAGTPPLKEPECGPEKNWDYDFGFAIAYATGGGGPRKSHLNDNFWKEKRFVVAVSEAQ